MNKLPNIKGLVDRAQLQGLQQPMFSRLDKDIPAGVVVFLVALPLCLGIALASGAPLISGLISGIIGGVVIGFISHSGTSVSGPAASVSAVVLVAIQSLGSFEIFLVALVIAGLIQIVFGILKAGLIADYMPTSIIKGLLAAIGLILIMSQLPYAVGLEFDKSRMLNLGEDYFGKAPEMITLFLESFTLGAIVLSFFSVFILLFWEKTSLKNFKLLPPALVVVILGVVVNSFLFKYLAPTLYLDGIHLVNIPKIESISSFLTFPDFPNAVANVNVWLTALTLAVIASISTLLNIEATDDLDPHKRRTPPNRELIAQGIGNTLAGLIGGIAITSVIVRSSVNISAKAETKFSTMLHGVLLLLSVLLLSNIINMIPLASLAAILLVVGYKLASVSVFRKLYKKGWNQFLPFVVTVAAILLTDVLLGVLIGTGLSIFFLLRSNYYNPFFIENAKLMQEEVIKLELSNEVSFLNKASIKKMLWSIPDDSKVVIDATFSSFVDQDVIDIIHDFQDTVAKEHNIAVRIIGLKEHYDMGEEIDFLEKQVEKVKQRSTPLEILEYLKEGSQKFMSGNIVSRRLRNKDLKDFLAPSPLAVVINCIDLREPLNMILNTEIGDLVPVRAAGNTMSEHVVQSAEIACVDQGAKLVLLMGHSENVFVQNAITAYLNQEEDSHLFPLIKDAVRSGKFSESYLRSKDLDVLANEITLFNLDLSKQKLLDDSDLLKEKIKEGKVGIASAFFDRKTGVVDFSALYV